MKFIIKLLTCLVATVAAEQVELQLRNQSDDYLSVHWVNPDTQETAVITKLLKPWSSSSVTTYLSHNFQLRQEVNPDTGQCGNDNDKECKTFNFQITEYDKQLMLIKSGFKVETFVSSPAQKVDVLINSIDLNNVVAPSNTLAKCKQRATQLLKELEGTVEDEDILRNNINDELHDCITVGLAPRIKASIDEVEFERSLRVEASNIAENFTCVNTELESSPDVVTEEWTSEKDGARRTVHKKLERTASKIHVVENFASPDECKAMEDEATKSLHVASTADGKGGTKISAGRKAMQAGIRPNFTDDGEPIGGNLISMLSGRVYEYTNHVLDLNITHHGQEPLMSIQYFGRGKHDIEPDRYTPHCDGRCNGRDHIYGGRMATMVIYCTIPEKGGFTNFQNANVHVKPNSGSAVFFSYFDPVSNLTDNGLTQHSGCPVYEGEKKIITQWVRYGVNSKTPYSAFNTLTILRSQDGE